ncbi:hypothetical protein GCM10027425_11470 [Alteromonas gracilis]
MTEQEPRDPAEAVGSVAEEAVKLMAALGDWARDHGEEAAETARGMADGMRHGLAEAAEHASAGAGRDEVAAECRWCPVCQVLHAVRGTSPEVRAHLAGAATSLAQAFNAMMASPSRPDARPGSGRQRPDGVEHIPLDEEETP